jgi:hypothetical protein
MSLGAGEWLDRSARLSRAVAVRAGGAAEAATAPADSPFEQVPYGVGLLVVAAKAL